MERLIAAEIWSELQVARGGKGVTRQRVAPSAAIDVYLAVEHPDRIRMVTFGVPTSDMAAQLDVPAAKGVEFRVVPSAGDDGWGHIEVRLADLRYAELFSALAEDLVQHIEPVAGPEKAIEGLSDRLRRWEAFLQVVPPDGLGHERRAGLFGELHTLRAHLIPLHRPLAIDAWVGPAGAHQDFQASGWALEVKTSRTKVPVSVRISGERQLDDTGLRFLGLAHIGLEQRRNSGETLPEIVASVRNLLSGTPEAERFESLLFAAGYHAAHEPRYLDDGYLVRFDELFRVEERFPRIIERHLPSGVGAVAYTIDISALEAYRVEWTSLPVVLSTGIDDGAD